MSETHILFLFVISKNVDSYINTLACFYREYQITKIVFIGIKNIPIKTNDSKTEDIIDSIRKRLEEIKQYNELYEEVRKLDYEIKSVNYKTLKKDLIPLFRKNKNNISVDITGCPKRFAIDIMSICLALGVENVYSFELLKPPDISNKNLLLYHNLKRCDFQLIKHPSAEVGLKNLEVFSLKLNKNLYKRIGVLVGITLLSTISYLFVPDNTIWIGLSLGANIAALYSVTESLLRIK